MTDKLLHYTVKFYDPNGFDEMYNIKSDDSAEFFAQISALKKWVLEQGYTALPPTPTPNGASAANANGAVTSGAPICPVAGHGLMVPSNHGSGWYCQTIVNPNGATKKEKFCQQTAA